VTKFGCLNTTPWDCWHVVPCPPRREQPASPAIPAARSPPEGGATLNAVFLTVAAMIAELIVTIEIPATKAPKWGYAAVFRAICKRRIDEGFT